MPKLMTWLAFAALSSNLAFADAPTRSPDPPEWTTPIAPFRIAGDLYYVGGKDLASYLLTTPQGNILINSGTESSVPLIKSAIAQLGFKYANIKILLISHAHKDHAGGSAQIIKETGARYVVMDADVDEVESGGRSDFIYSDMTFPPVTVGRVIHDGENVRLADAVLVAHKTPGHTPGCTTWTLQVKEGERRLNVVYYAHMFEVLKALPCDVFLGAHGQYFDMLEKLDRQKSAPGAAVWIDPTGYQAALAAREKDFRDELKKQQGTG
jgi:metallo-beta-lactamase class B